MVRPFLLIFFVWTSAYAETAITKFENTNVQDKSFLSNAFEAGKLYLLQGTPEKTIAITQFYRSFFLSNEQGKKHFFQENFYQLEIISLAKYCRWEIIERLMNEYQETLNLLQMPKDKFQELQNQMAQSQILQETLKEKAIIPATEEASFETDTKYKVNHAILSHASHPKHFRFLLENKCQKRY